MKQIFALSAAVAVCALAGCTLFNPVNKSVTQTTNSTGIVTSITNLTINPIGLQNDELSITAAASLAAIELKKHVPNAVQFLNDYQIALKGILSGASTNSTSELVALWSKTPDPDVISAIQPFLQALSTAEQTWLAGVSGSVYAQIDFGFAKAASSGLALQGITGQ